MNSFKFVFMNKNNKREAKLIKYNMGVFIVLKKIIREIFIVLK